MKRRAMTLLEVIFVTGLLGLFVLMVSQALVLGFRAHRRTMERTANTRQATVVLTRMLREIAVTYTWVSPATGTMNWHPSAPASFSWNRTSRTGVLVPVDYWLDVTTKELRKKDPLLPSGYRVVTRNVEDFQIDHPSDDVVKVTLTLKDDLVPLVIVGRPQRV